MTCTLDICGEIRFKNRNYSADEIRQDVTIKLKSQISTFNLFPSNVDYGFITSLFATHIAKSFYVPFPLHSKFEGLGLNLEMGKLGGGYLIPTSGSTGEPKIVLGSWVALIDYIDTYKKLFPSAKLNFCNLTSPSFDPFFREIYTPLLSRHRLVLLDSESLRSDVISLVEWIKENDINVIHIVPTMLRSLISVGVELSSVKYVMIAGEPLYWKDVERFQDIFSSECVFFNLYGPTETTLSKLLYQIDVGRCADDGCVPLGKPLGDSKVIVLDDSGLPCNMFGRGEIIIRHKYPSHGYVEFSDSGLLLKKPFIQNPFSLSDHVPVYKTGDIGYLDSKGDINFVGRNDSIVKLNGVKISTLKIEIAVKSIADIDQLIVKVVDVNETDKKIALFYCGARNESEIRNLLKKSLNPIEVPSFIIKCESLPLTHSGKIARSLLTVPPSLLNFKKELDPVDDAVTVTYRESLGEVNCEINPSFILSGGQSIDAIQIISKLKKKTGVSIKLKQFFELDSATAISDFIRSNQTEQTSEEYGNAGFMGDKSLTLLRSQERFRNQIISSNSRLYRFQFPWAVLLKDASDISKIEQSIKKMLQLCKWVFDVSFDLSQNVQFLNPNPSPIKKLSVSMKADLFIKSDDFMDLINTPFDLGSENPINIFVIELAGNEAIILIVNHILCSDGNTRRNMLGMLSKIISGEACDNNDYLRYYKEKYDFSKNAKSLSYWKDLIKNTNLSHELYKRPVCERSGTVTFIHSISSHDKTLISDCCKQKNISLSSFFINSVTNYIAENSALLGNYLVVSNSNRHSDEDMKVIGCLTDSILIPTSINPSLNDTHNLIMDCIDNSVTPFLSIVESCFEKTDLRDYNMFPVIFAIQPGLDGAFTPKGIEFQEIRIERNFWIWPIEIYVSVADEITINVNCSDDERTKDAANNFIDHLKGHILKTLDRQ